MNKDCLSLIARQIDDLQTLVSFSIANKKCQEIVNQMISRGESKWITTEYYETVTHENDIWVYCYIPEISDRTCLQRVFHGIEIIRVIQCDTISYITRNWFMNTAAIVPLIDKPGRAMRAGDLPPICNIRTKYNFDSLYYKFTDIFPCSDEEIKELFISAKSLNSFS